MQGESVLQHFGNFQTLPQLCSSHFYFFNFLSTFFLRLVRNSISLAARSSASFCFAYKKSKITILPCKKGETCWRKCFSIVRIFIRIHKYTIPPTSLHSICCSKERQVRLQNFCISNYITTFNIIFLHFYNKLEHVGEN
jgi:hypothetical protein